MASHSGYAVVHCREPLPPVSRPDLAAMSEKRVSQHGKKVGKIPEIFDVKRAGMPPWPPSRDAAESSAHPYEIEFARKELLEQATRRLSLDRRSAPTDTDVDILIPRLGAAWAIPCSAIVVDQGSHRPWSCCLAGWSAESEGLVSA